MKSLKDIINEGSISKAKLNVEPQPNGNHHGAFAFLENVDNYQYIIFESHSGAIQLYEDIRDLLGDWNEEEVYFDKKEIEKLKVGQTLRSKDDPDTFLLKF